MTKVTEGPEQRRRFIPAVIGLAIRKDGSFLLTQRNQPQDPDVHLKWNIPGGGIEWGEEPKAALKREFMEELGVDLGVSPLSFLTQYPVPVTALWPDAHILLLAYAVDIGDQVVDITRDPEQETAAYRWFTLNDLDSVESLPQTKDTVRAILTLIQQKQLI